jgi:hypothetical protein
MGGAEAVKRGRQLSQSRRQAVAFNLTVYRAAGLDASLAWSGELRMNGDAAQLKRRWSEGLEVSGSAAAASVAVVEAA